MYAAGSRSGFYRRLSVARSVVAHFCFIANILGPHVSAGFQEFDSFYKIQWLPLISVVEPDSRSGENYSQGCLPPSTFLQVEL